MAEDLVELLRVFRAALVAFEPGLYSGEDCAVLVEELAPPRRSVLRLGCGRRLGPGSAARTGNGASPMCPTGWPGRPAPPPARPRQPWRRPRPGVAARGKAALEAGELSFAQARELVKTEAAVPGSAAGLLDVAKSESLRTLKEKAGTGGCEPSTPRNSTIASTPPCITALDQRLGNVAYRRRTPARVRNPVHEPTRRRNRPALAEAHQEANRQRSAFRRHLAAHGRLGASRQRPERGARVGARCAKLLFG